MDVGDTAGLRQLAAEAAAGAEHVSVLRSRSESALVKGWHAASPSSAFVMKALEAKWHEASGHLLDLSVALGELASVLRVLAVDLDEAARAWRTPFARATSAGWEVVAGRDWVEVRTTQDEEQAEAHLCGRALQDALGAAASARRQALRALDRLHVPAPVSDAPRRSLAVPDVRDSLLEGEIERTAGTLLAAVHHLSALPGASR